MGMLRSDCKRESNPTHNMATHLVLILPTSPIYTASGEAKHSPRRGVVSSLPRRHLRRRALRGYCKGNTAFCGPRAEVTIVYHSCYILLISGQSAIRGTLYWDWGGLKALAGGRKTSFQASSIKEDVQIEERPSPDRERLAQPM